MKKDLTLVIMAAGMGSRFGGLKQIEPIGPSGEFIIDYSIHDALKAGFTKVVFIIKEENYEIFKETVGNRISDQVSVEYVFQKQDNIPEGVVIPNDRVKPWGTAHAIYSCKDVVKGDFAIINADDFYGEESFYDAANFFKENHNNEYAVIGYKVINTITDAGSVKRGICEVNGDYLTSIIESNITKTDDAIIASPLDEREAFTIESDCYVSMNMICFTDDLFDYLVNDINDFFNRNKDNLEKCEYLIPDVLEENIKKDLKQVRVIKTNAVWMGMTYKEDKELLVNGISELINKGVYPKILWS